MPPKTSVYEGVETKNLDSHIHHRQKGPSFISLHLCLKPSLRKWYSSIFYEPLSIQKNNRLRGATGMARVPKPDKISIHGGALPPHSILQRLWSCRSYPLWRPRIVKHEYLLKFLAFKYSSVPNRRACTFINFE